MSEAQRIFLAGIGRHNAGQIGEAETLYDQALRLAPDHYEALHFKGVAALQLGRGEEAVELISRAISLKPDMALFFLNQGLALKAIGRLAEAKQAFSQAMRLQPSDGAAQLNLALVMYAQGEFSEAEAEILHLLARFPKQAEGFFALGQVLLALARHSEAEQAFAKAVKLNPQYREARLALADILSAQGKFLEAAQAFKEAIDCEPGLLTARSALGDAYREAGLLDQALAAYDELIAIETDNASAYCGRAKVNHLRLDFGAAFADLGQALELDANHREARIIRAALSNETGDFDQAAVDYRALLREEPEKAEWRSNIAIHLLRDGRIVEGFREYEWRSKCDDFVNVEYPGEPWQGQSILGKTLFIFPEQGFGDFIQFSRFLPTAAKLAGRIVLGCPSAVASIFSRFPCVAEVVPTGAKIPSYDFHASLLSLPFLLGIDEAGIISQIPYIEAAPERVALWSDRLRRSGDKRPLIGLIWQGNPAYPTDAKRSAPLSMFKGLLERTDCRFLSLQKEYGIEQIAALPNGGKIEEIGSQFADFDDTAALLSQLDLLISIDTAVVHLAGAMGRPAWLCLPMASDWRWMRGGETSPWYPSIRIFRQSKMGDWPELFSRLNLAFSEWRETR
jgi:tetratricopeptide (TPR) repeat protein